jgi:hypothetical protein
MRPTRPTSNRSNVGIRKGFRSGLEVKIAKQLEEAGIPVRYEEQVIKYVKPSREHKYHPDFLLPNGILIESKGIFETADREKHLLVKAQHPDLDIRFVFSRSAAPLYKGSPTTYAMWCNKHGFVFADKLIPVAWLREGSKAA